MTDDEREKKLRKQINAYQCLQCGNIFHVTAWEALGKQLRCPECASDAVLSYYEA